MQDLSGQTPKILVVEDEMLIRMLTADMLEMLGYGVLEAETGAQALAFAQGDVHFHAMLIDLGLPDCSGEDVLRQIAQLKPGLQIVVATGADTSAVRIRVGADPAISYLEKPFQFSDLEAILPPVQSAAAS
jgi:DNA-binding response OmpR family regulator